jgi:hypothetical protein
MMGRKSHALGVCSCASHVDRPWNRSEHWTAADVDYLESRFGLQSDVAIARHLNRSVVGIRLKAKRLGLRKKDAGLTARDVAQIFGVDDTTVSKHWIRDGVLRSKRPYMIGLNKVHLVMEDELERFIREHGECIDIDKMPDSLYRDLALAGGRWYSLPEIQHLTGRNAHVVSSECLRGRWPARKRGQYWYVHESQVDAITATAGLNGRYASPEKRERTLAMRRNVRKGVETPRPHPLLGSGRPEPVWWRRVECPEHRGEECATCGGKGVVLRNRNEIQQLPEGWAA